MKSFEITSSTTNSQFVYKNDELIVNGNYAKDATTGALQSINGSCYAKDASGNQGQYVGNFNGYVRDGGIKYSFSEMSLADLNKVEAAVEDIEAEITKKN